MKSLHLILLLVAALLAPNGWAQTEKKEPTRIEDVIYGRKSGVALTMDVYKPDKPNGYGVVWVVSGGWFSSKAVLQKSDVFLRPFLNRGYTVFAVVHGSQPKFTIPEITEDMHRAVRYIRHHAKEYGIDPDKIGISGGSAGGHLSLTIGTQGGRKENKGGDDVDKESSAVQAVACFYPPTDFLNYGAEGVDGVGHGILKNFKPAFGPEADTPEGRQKLGRKVSPIYYITSNMPPMLIIHGDADQLVPIQQAETFVKRAEEAGATAKLVVREGKSHGWPGIGADVELFADWFDKHLRGK